MRCQLKLLCVVIVLYAGFIGASHAEDLTEVLRLKGEGLVIFRAGKDKGLSSVELADNNNLALVKFEKAMSLLDAMGEGEAIEAMRADISGLIYWTRKTTPMIIGSRPRSKSPATPKVTPATKAKPKSVPAKPLPVTKVDRKVVKSKRASAKPMMLSRGEKAEVLYQRAIKFAGKEGKKDPFAVALAFFEVADRFTGTPQSLKALEKARYFQMQADEKDRKTVASTAKLIKKGRYLDKGSAAKPWLVKGDKAYAFGDFQVAEDEYQLAVNKDSHLVTWRALGHAQFEYAKRQHHAYAEGYERYSAAYKAANILGHERLMARAKGKVASLEALATGALGAFGKSRNSFESALKQSPDGRDLDSEVHLALTYAVLPDDASQRMALQRLETIIGQGQPGDLGERMLYEYAKTMAKMLKK